MTGQYMGTCADLAEMEVAAVVIMMWIMMAVKLMLLMMILACVASKGLQHVIMITIMIIITIMRIMIIINMIMLVPFQMSETWIARSRHTVWGGQIRYVCQSICMERDRSFWHASWRVPQTMTMTWQKPTRQKPSRQMPTPMTIMFIIFGR
jgi:hypothetical protein